MSIKFHSEKSRKKMSELKKGHTTTEETKEKIRNKLKGRKSPMKGRKQSIESRKKMSLSMKGRIAWNRGLKGEKNSNWRGGISFLPYSIDWTQSLRISIRERDHYICQICGQKQSDIAYQVHHIDYNKQNCNPNNLITLCKSCHMKTNFNRNYWMRYLKNKIC